MSNFVWPSIGIYCLFGNFVFYQQVHAKNFRGASHVLGLALQVSVLLGTLTGIIYLGYYGWNISWWAAAVIVLFGLIASVGGLILERCTGPFVLSILGFIGWPVCAYFMFKVLPSGA